MNTHETTTSRTMCPMNCHPTFCGMEVTVRDGEVVSIAGDPANPDSEGFLCVRGLAAQEIPHNPRRILQPMMRKNRNSDTWQPVSWDTALDRIVANLEQSGRERFGFWAGHGSIANDYGVFAHTALGLRLANMAGMQAWDLCMICWGLGGFGIGLTGALEVNTKEDMSAHADLIVQWGSNHVSQPNTARHITAAKRRGAKVVAIDIRESEACRSAAEHFIVKPGTDAAFALAMINVIIAERLHDEAFVTAHTLGFAELSAHVQQFTPHWAAAICGIEAGRIADFAREYAATERAMLLLSGASMYKDQHGWESSRAISCLPALTGKLGKPGTGFGPRHAGLPHGHGLADIANFAARPPGDYIPNQMSAIGEAVIDGTLKGMLLFGSNFVSSFPNARAAGEGLAAMDLVVSHDLFMNDTARRFADIVLPGTSWLEEIGVKGTATHLYLMDRILEPAGESRSMSRVVRELAARLGVEDFYPWEGETGHIDAVLDHPASGHASVSKLRAAGGSLPMNISPVAHPTHEYATPSGKLEFYSERAAASDLSPLPGWTPRPAARFPLELRMGRSINHFHSFYDGGRALPALVRRDRQPLLWISPADADQRGISDRQAIRISNERATFAAHANVTDRVPNGTVWIHDGWPGLNDLTNGTACLTDAAAQLFPFSTGQSAFDAFVEVEARG